MGSRVVKLDKEYLKAMEIIDLDLVLEAKSRKSMMLENRRR